jgi:protein-tyrosine phosphatase
MSSDSKSDGPYAQRRQGEPVRILFVCMGNICRSPTAEAVFRSLAQRSWPELAVEADSAGTHSYHAGRAPDERAQRVARAHGIDMSAQRARVLRAQDFDRFDRILVMDLQNQKAALALAPPRQRHRVQLLLDYAPQLGVREVPDPYYGGLADFEHVFELSEQAASGLLQSLAGGR